MFVEKKEDIKKKARIWRTFSQARAFVHALGLKSTVEWRDYCKSGKKPPDIPSDPRRRYRAEYKSIEDWLGTEYLSFPEARAFVHTLNFKSSNQWREYCKSGQKPHDIPTMPERYGSEFKGYGDWLGTDNVAPTKRVFRPFTEARAYVHSLKI